jgi:hypothetical protein
LGVISSGLIVATITKSRSRASVPESWRARRAANTAMSLVPSLAAARRRERIPVRLTIQWSSTPMRSAMWLFGTISVGR